MFHLHPALPLDIDALWSLRTAPVRVIAPNRPPSEAPRRCRLAMPACKRLLAALEDLPLEHGNGKGITCQLTALSQAAIPPHRAWRHLS